MPQLDSVSWIVWTLVLILQPVVAVVMISKGLWRRWPSVFAFLCFRSIISFALLGMTVAMPDTDTRAAAYFYTYWGGTAVGELLQVWMLLQIALDLGGASKVIRRRLCYSIPAISLAALTISVLLSFSAPMTATGRIVTVVIDLDKAFSLGWLFSFLAVAVFSEFLGIEWSPVSLGIAIGMAVEALGQTVVTWALSIWASSWNHLSELAGIFYCVCLLTWGTSFFRRQYPPPAIPPEQVVSWIGAMARIMKKLRKTP